MRMFVFGILLSLFASEVVASECSTTVYSTYQTAYPYYGLAVMGSNKPVLQSGSTVSCGDWWFDLFGSKDLAGDQTFGNEVDLTLARESNVASAWGSFHYQLYVEYGAVPKFDLMKDDIAEVHVDFSRPFTVGVVSFTPFVRPTYMIGFGVYPDRMLVRWGTRIRMPLTERLSFAGELAVASDFYAHVNTKRFNGGLYLDVGDGFTLQTGVKLADSLKGAFFAGFTKQL